MNAGHCIRALTGASSNFMRTHRWPLFIALVALARVASAQLQLAEARGVVREPQGEPAHAATVRLLDFGNPFSGTHFGPPRTLAAKIRVEIR